MSGEESAALGRDFVGLIQAFGVLRTDSTPCGQPVSVSTAHALCELAGRPRSQKELARRLGLEPSSVSRLVDQLQTKGWAHRIPDAVGTDSRVRLVELTHGGLEMAARVQDARAQRFARLLDAIEVDKRPQILEALELLRRAAHDLD